MEGDGAADRPVLYYNTNHHSCFTTPVVGFKECLGGPAPVLVQSGQSSAGTGEVGTSPARGSQGTHSLPVSQTGGYLPGFCRLKTTSELDEHGELLTALPTTLPPPRTPAPSAHPGSRQAHPAHPRLVPGLPAAVYRQWGSPGSKELISLPLSPLSTQAGNDCIRLPQHPIVAVGYGAWLSPRALAAAFLCGLPWPSPRPGRRRARQRVSQVCSPRGTCPRGTSYHS